MRCVFSSDPVVSSSIFVGAKEKRISLGMVPTRASFQLRTYCCRRRFLLRARGCCFGTGDEEVHKNYGHGEAFMDHRR